MFKRVISVLVLTLLLWGLSSGIYRAWAKTITVILPSEIIIEEWIELPQSFEVEEEDDEQQPPE